MRKERSKKVNILICIAVVLLCTVLLLAQLIGDLNAGFSKTENINESADIAMFDISQEGTFFKNLEAAAKPGETDNDMFITIVNKSEVAMKYTLTVKNETENLPLTLTLRPEDNAPGIQDINEGDDVCTITAQQKPGEHTDKYCLNVLWKTLTDTANETDKQKEAEENLERMGMVDHITVSVTAVQVD